MLPAYLAVLKLDQLTRYFQTKFFSELIILNQITFHILASGNSPRSRTHNLTILIH